jgi:AraC-like DNA-binding protein
MSVIEKFATNSVAPLRRLDYWNKIVADTFAGLAVDSPDEVFSARMSRWQLGDLTMIRPLSQQAVVRRWRDGTADPIDRVIFHLQHRGHCLNGQWQREAPLGSGDFAIIHGGESYFTELSPENEMLVVEMPRAALASRLPNLEDHLCKLIPGSAPGSRLVHDFLLSLWQQGDQSDADPDWQDGIANVFIDLLAFAVRGAGTRLAVQPGQAARIKALIDSRLHDPELKTAMIACELGISARTVQNVFAAIGTTPSAYILHQRLKRAADRLTTARGQSITEIAYELGFNESAYFTRCFRQQFGVTPSAWRGHH